MEEAFCEKCSLSNNCFNLGLGDCVSSLWWALGDLSLRAFGRAALKDKAHRFWHWNVQDPRDLIFDRFPVFYIYCINQLSVTQYWLVTASLLPGRGKDLVLNTGGKSGKK